jgi:drug/metabolite transporter (DMT)-like permease
LLHEQLPRLSYFGLGMIAIGIYLASKQASSRQAFLVMPRSAVVWALVSGLFISIYSLFDKLLVRLVPPWEYNWWVYAGNTVTWLPFVWPPRRVRANFQELYGNWVRVLIGSAMTVGAYVAVLTALTMTSASYVVAARGTSVVFGAFLGCLVLGEGYGRSRILGSVLIALGLALLAFAN